MGGNLVEGKTLNGNTCFGCERNARHFFSPWLAYSCVFVISKVRGRNCCLTSCTTLMPWAQQIPPHVRLFDCLRAISGHRVFGWARSCLVTIMGLNGSWPHRRAFACWQPPTLPLLQRLKVRGFSGKVHFSSAPKQVEAGAALFTETAWGGWETSH